MLTAARGSKGSDRQVWSLKMVVLQRTRLRTLALTWSRAIASELVYLLEDGSAHLLNLAPALAADGVPDISAQVGLSLGVDVVHLLQQWVHRCFWWQRVVSKGQ